MKKLLLTPRLLLLMSLFLYVSVLLPQTVSPVRSIGDQVNYTTWLLTLLAEHSGHLLEKGIMWDCKSRSQGVECRGETVPRHNRCLSYNPDLASCYVLVWNRLLSRPGQASNHPPGSTRVLVPMTILPPLSCMILWHLSSSMEIHFVLQLPNTCLVYISLNTLNYQTLFCAIHLQSRFSVSEPFPGSAGTNNCLHTEFFINRRKHTLPCSFSHCYFGFYCSLLKPNILLKPSFSQSKFWAIIKRKSKSIQREATQIKGK